jgi:catechol 2,3-dioxygenase-like lactoylglutathione lyase family enzyme
MSLPVKLDHCVIHVSEWERSNAFYRDVLGAELVKRPAGWAYRFGDAQLNVHGPGVQPAEVARLPVQPGNSDLCFEWNGPIAEAWRISIAEVSRSSEGRRGASAPRARVPASIFATRTDRSWSSCRTRQHD